MERKSQKGKLNSKLTFKREDKKLKLKRNNSKRELAIFKIQSRRLRMTSQKENRKTRDSRKLSILLKT